MESEGTSKGRLTREWRRIAQSELARNAGRLLAGRGLSVVLQGAYLVLLARLLGRREYGVYVSALAIVTVLSRYSSLGTPELFFRYIGLDPGKFPVYWGMVLSITVTFGAVLAGVFALFGPHFAPNISRAMLVCVAIGECIGTQLTASAARIFLAFERATYTVMTSLIVNLARTILAGLMLWRWHHGTAQQWAMAALVVSTIASTGSVMLVIRLYGRPEFSLGLVRQRLGEGLVFAMSNSTAGAYNDIDKAMLGHYGMEAANGIYTMAYRVIDACTAPIASIHAAAFPRFFRKGVDGIRATAAYSLLIVRRTAPLALFFTAAMLLGAPMLPRLAGKDFAESVVALRWLCLLPLFRSLQLAAGDGVTGAGYQGLRLCGMAGAAAFNIAVNLYLIPRYSWRGAAWSSLATDGALAAFNWLLLGWLLLRQHRKLEAPAPSGGALVAKPVEVFEAASRGH